MGAQSSRRLIRTPGIGPGNVGENPAGGIRPRSFYWKESLIFTQGVAGSIPVVVIFGENRRKRSLNVV